MSDREYLKSKILENQSLSLPHISTQMKTLGQSIVNNIKQIATGGSLRASEAETQRRLGICQTCPLFMADKMRCSICGCYLKVKATLQAERCPKAKW